MHHPLRVFTCVLFCAGLGAGLATAQSPGGGAADVVATLELSQQFYYAGDPFMLRISIGNNGGQTIRNPVKSPLLAGFRVRGRGVDLESAKAPEGLEPARPETLAPRSFYGAVIDLAQLFPGLGNVGKYEVSWSADGVSSQTLVVSMLPKYDAEKDYLAEIDTDDGAIVIEFYRDKAPIATKAFVDMANAGFYDGLLFHEVHKDWYISGGDPQYGGTRRIPFVYPAEPSTMPIVAGSVVMKPVRPSPPANGSEFMIVLRPEPSWAGQVTVVGQVVRGLHVARAISREASTLQSSRPYFKPLKDVKIRKITVREKPAVAEAAN